MRTPARRGITPHGLLGLSAEPCRGHSSTWVHGGFDRPKWLTARTTITMASASTRGTATCTCRIRTPCPPACPTNMAAMEIRRRPDLEPFPPPSALSAPIPVHGQWSGQWWSGQGRPTVRTLEFWMPMDPAEHDDERVAEPGSRRAASRPGRAPWQRRASSAWVAVAAANMMATVMAEPLHDRTSDSPNPGPNRHQGHHRRRDGEAVGHQPRQRPGRRRCPSCWRRTRGPRSR